MTCLNVVGRGETFFLQSESTAIDATGIVEKVCTYLYRVDAYDLDYFFTEVQNEIGAEHEDYAHLRCVNVTASAEAGFHKATYTYKGIENATNTTQINVEMGLSQEPIETHPEFEDFAGKPNGEKNGAVFNADGTFKAFEIDSNTCPLPAETGKQGVSSYLSPTCVVSEMKTYGSQLSVTPVDVGTIVEPNFKHEDPGGGGITSMPKIPASSGVRNYLIIGEERQSYADGEVVKTKHRMSGLRKWNDEIYA